MTASNKPTGLIDRIMRASTPQEVQELVAFACSHRPMPDATLRRINRAAVRRNKELSKP